MPNGVWDPPEECHRKAWSIVGDFLASNLRMFCGKPMDAESTVLPRVSSWLQESLGEIPEVRSFEDHGVIIWGALPTAGIIGAGKYDFCLTAVSNLLSLYKRNGIAILVHPNRAAQMTRTNPPKFIV